MTTDINILSFDLPDSDEDIYTDEKFSNFLTETKKNLEKFTVEDNVSEVFLDNNEIIKDEADQEFMKFLGELKSLSVKSERSHKSSFRCSSPNISRSSDISDSFHNDSFKKPLNAKNENIPASSISEFEEKYKKMFDVSSEKCAVNLYKYFNEKVFDNKLPLGMDLVWSAGLRSTAGKTTAKKKGNIYCDCKIILSTKVLTSYERLRDTLLHEMCHAAVWMISQISGDNHGPLWHTWASRCNLILPHIDVPQRCHNYEISFPFYYQCNKCSWKCGRHRKSAKLAKALCPKCRLPLTLVKA